MVQPRHPRNALGDLALGLTGCAQAAQVAFDIRRKHRHAGVTERFGQALQGDGLAGAGGARHQAMTVCQTHGLGNRLSREVGTDNELQ
ncbi:hypothetical protein D3C86_1949990 [compost metagenome]